MNTKTLLSLLTLNSSLLTLSAAVPLRWTVETSRAVPAQFEAYQGETLELEAAMQSYGKPLALDGIAALYWQTNGMGNAYWQATAAVNSNRLSAVWTPEMDVGAKVYNCYIGSPSNIYHAAFQLRLRPSPGAVPNTLPLPVPVIDFARVRVLNPPWPGGGGGGSTDTNVVRELVDTSFIGGTNAVNAIPPRITALETEVAAIPRITPFDDVQGWARNARWSMHADEAETADEAYRIISFDGHLYSAEDVAAIETSATNAETQVAKKMDKETSDASGYLAVFNSNGNAVKSGIGLVNGSNIDANGWIDAHFGFFVNGNMFADDSEGEVVLYTKNGDLVRLPATGGTMALTSDIPEPYTPDPADAAFSNAVLAVGLNIDTNSVATLNSIAATFGDFPLGPGETATTVGGLLAALAAAVAWLRKRAAHLDNSGFGDNEFAADLMSKPGAVQKVQGIVNAMFDNGDTTAYPRTTGEG